MKFREEGLINRLWRSLNVKKREIHFCIFFRELYATKTKSDETNYFRQAPCQFFCSLKVCFEVVWVQIQSLMGFKTCMQDLGCQVLLGQDWWKNDVSIQNLEATCTNEGIADATLKPSLYIGKPHGLLRQCIVPRPQEQTFRPIFWLSHVWNTLPVKAFAGSNAGP